MAAASCGNENLVFATPEEGALVKGGTYITFPASDGAGIVVGEAPAGAAGGSSPPPSHTGRRRRRLGGLIVLLRRVLPLSQNPNTMVFPSSAYQKIGMTP